jgi:hypothetical protein
MSRKITLRDYNQITAFEHDESLDAKRVIVVGGEMPTFNIPELKMPEIQKIEVPVIITQKELQVERIEVPVIVKETEIKEIEKQVIVLQKEWQVERVEIPIVQKEIEVIEKPVILKEIVQQDLPSWIKALLAAQALISLIMLLKK